MGKPIICIPKSTGSTEPRDVRDRFSDKLNIKDFGAKGTGYYDDRDALYEALKRFFNNPYKYKVLDLNGYNIGLKSNIKIRFGEGAFPVYQSRSGDIYRGLTICNGMLTWLGEDDPDPDSYMIDIGTNSNNQAELVDFKFFNVTFNGHQKQKNLVKVFNFYDLYFSQCIFSNFNDGVAVFLPSTTDGGVYCDDNGATFWDCRWYDLPSSTMNGTPILSYCGDLVVSRGFAEWCKPFDFHIGSILFDGFHWSYGSGAASLNRMAIFRDPREIQIIGCDIDQGTFLFTTEGHFDPTKQLANTSWRQIVISNNKFVCNASPDTGEGLINFKISGQDTSLFGIHILGNAADAYVDSDSDDDADDDVVDFVKVIDGGGTISVIRGIYEYNDSWGMLPGDLDLGTAAFNCSNSRVSTLTPDGVGAKFIGDYSIAGSMLRGSEIRFSYGARITSDGSNGLVFKTSADDRWKIWSNGPFVPAVDNTYNMGAASYRVKEVFSATGSINTSDVREKKNITQPSDTLMRAWEKVHFKVFQFISSVEEKGENDARLHIGVIAQEVNEAFASEGLDASKYGLFCYDEWEDDYKDVEIVDKEAVFDSFGREINPAETHIEHRLITPAGNRYGIRYEEALALECAYQRWLGEKRYAEIESLKSRIAALENKG